MGTPVLAGLTAEVALQCRNSAGVASSADTRRKVSGGAGRLFGGCGGAATHVAAKLIIYRFSAAEMQQRRAALRNSRGNAGKLAAFSDTQIQESSLLGSFPARHCTRILLIRRAARALL